MNPYVTGTVIKGLRERKGLTQAQLAARLQVSDKAVSKWETPKATPTSPSSSPWLGRGSRWSRCMTST